MACALVMCGEWLNIGPKINIFIVHLVKANTLSQYIGRQVILLQDREFNYKTELLKSEDK